MTAIVEQFSGEAREFIRWVGATLYGGRRLYPICSPGDFPAVGIAQGQIVVYVPRQNDPITPGQVMVAGVGGGWVFGIVQPMKDRRDKVFVGEVVVPLHHVRGKVVCKARLIQQPDPQSNPNLDEVFRTLDPDDIKVHP
jgi:hypothetical protein